MAIVLALCRNVAQAQAVAGRGRWDRGKFKGSELYGKTLGVARLRPHRAARRQAAPRASTWTSIAYDKFVTAERFRELGVEGVESPEELFAGADFISLHLPKTPETVDFDRRRGYRADARGRPDRQLRARAS